MSNKVDRWDGFGDDELGDIQGGLAALILVSDQNGCPKEDPGRLRWLGLFNEASDEQSRRLQQRGTDERRHQGADPQA